METLYIYILLGLAWFIFNRYLTIKKRNFPPTPWLACTRIFIYGLFKKPVHRTLSHISNNRPILLLRFRSRRILLISSASAAKDLFTNHDRTFANRPDLTPAKAFNCNGTNLAWEDHGDGWRHLRRVSCLEMLPFHRLQEQHDSLADEMKHLLRKLYRNQEVSLNLKSMFLELVFTFMMTMFAGKWFCQKKTIEGEENGFKSLLENTIDSFKVSTCDPDLAYFMPMLKSLTDLEERCKKLQKESDSLMNRLMKEIRDKPFDSFDGCQKDRTVIQYLMEKQKIDMNDQQKKDPDDQHKKDPYADDIIEGLVPVLVSAGTDTSTGILEWAFSLLLNHPEVLKKARKEIDEYVGNDRFLEKSDIKHLPYLRCIVKETMRIYPVAPLLVPHKSSKDCNVGGYNIPKGTMLMVNAWAIHNDPETWKEPEKFNPERFKDILDERDGFKLMPFGYGRRSCPGKHMATHLITSILGSLIQCFDWERDGEELVDLTEQPTGLALLKDKPLIARCRPRSIMENLISQI